MDRPKRLGFYWIREREGSGWEPAELVSYRGYLEAMVLGYNVGIRIDEIHEWGVELVPPPDGEVREVKD